MNVHALDRIVAQSQLLYTQQEVVENIVRVAEVMNQQLSGSEWTVVTILNGGIVFAGRVIPHLRFAMSQDYIHATRYQNGTSGGKLEILARPTMDIEDKNILLLDDIFDHGVTLSEITRYFQANGAARVCTAVMVRKNLHGRQEAESGPDFHALTVPDVYVYGMGMDYKGYLRNAPGIYAFLGETSQ